MKFFVTLLCAAALLPAATIQVSIDTSSLNAQAGTIDIQFNPGGAPGSYEAATVEILDFVLGGSGSLGSIAFGPDGGVFGTLPGPLTLVNSDFLNGVTYHAIFGNTLSFLVNFSGDGFFLPDQLIFSGLYVGLNGTSDTLVAQADFIGGGQIDTSLSSAGVTFQAASSDVPESSTFGLIAVLFAAYSFRKVATGSRTAARRAGM